MIKFKGTQQHRWIRLLACSLSCLVFTATRARAVRPLGIDVSNHQGPSINWTTVKNGGITFAWAKATEGTTFNDADFTINETNAKSAGVFIGAYHYARPDLHTGTSGADQEAAHFWSIASPYIKGGNSYLMPMLDVEQDLSSASPAYTRTTLSQWVNEWCSDIKADAAAAGYSVTPVIYTYVSYASTWLDPTVAQNWPLWMASWPTNPNPQMGAPSGTSPWQSGAWQFWQYADTGIGGGDSDVLNGDANVLKDYIVGSTGRFADGSQVQTTTSLKAYDSSAANGSFVTEPAGEIGTVLQGPIYGASYQRWQIHYNDGHTGWSAEDFLNQVVPEPTSLLPIALAAFLLNCGRQRPRR